jgi:hypothetical protein
MNFQEISTINDLLKKAEKQHDPEQMKMGVKVEAEHKPTIEWLKKYYQEHNEWPPDEDVYEHISSDHLLENEKYYTYLAKMEKEFEKE